jgi:D-alanyl-D-alanine dipeptidase
MRISILYILLVVPFFSIGNILSPVLERDSSEIEKVFVYLNLQNVQSVDSSIKVDMRYATTNNFMKMNMYGSLDQAYLQKDVVKKLVKAQHLLKLKYPNYSLIIFDATRPVSIQQLMWDKIDVPANMKSKYLSNPKYGSLHNYGAAVDVSIVDENNQLLDMATDFDSFEKLAYPYYQERYYKSGKLTEQEYQNRKLLQSVMKSAGFMTITTEWWHFNSCYRKEAKQWYTRVFSHKLSDYKTKENLSAEAEITDELVFKVQIYTSGKAKSLDWKKLRNKADFRYFHNGLYKYTTGQFKSMSEAHAYKRQMRKLGFKGSFVVPFYKGKRISIKDANVLMQ